MITTTARSAGTVAATVGLVATLLAAAAGTAHSAPVDSTAVYVAMGDSYSAGSGVSPQAPTTAASICLRSSANYPSLVAAQLGITRFTDVTCGAAKSTDLAGSQPDPFGPDHAPQFDALTPDTTLVTLGIGGNDIGLVELAASCINPLPEPAGRSCAAANLADGRDPVGERIEAFAPTYGTLFDEIRERAPRAHIVLVGYPVAMQPNGCPGVQPAWAADANYIQDKITQLNQVMADQAAAHDVTFISLEASSTGHDACADPDARWMVGAIPSVPDGFVPLHPNAAGHANTAEQILAVIAG